MKRFRISLVVGLAFALIFAGNGGSENIKEQSFFLPNFIFDFDRSSDEDKIEVVKVDDEEPEIGFYFLKLFDLF